MDMLRSMLGELRDPWRSEIRTLLVDPSPNCKIGDLVMTYGISSSTVGNVLQGFRAHFEPFHGLVSGDDMVFIEGDDIQIPTIPSGSTFGVADAKLVSINPFTVRLLEQSQMHVGCSRVHQ